MIVVAVVEAMPWWYWVAALVAGVLLLAGPVCEILEARADRRDREAWGKRPGATR